MKAASEVVGEPSWDEPPNAMVVDDYNTIHPEQLAFFKANKEYNSFRSHFFMRWYSNIQFTYADVVLGEACRVFGDTLISTKVSD